MSDALLQELVALETELHHDDVRRSRQRLDELLHPAFREVGRSGRAYSRDEVIDQLTSAASHPHFSASDFNVALLAPDVALLTYRCAHVVSDASMQNHAFRSSIWIKSAQTWQLRYHQGTPSTDPQ